MWVECSSRVLSLRNSLRLLDRVSNALPEINTMMVQTLLQRLVQQIETTSSKKVLHCDRDQVHEVIFESDIDGTPYYVVRCLSENPETFSRIHLSPREKSIVELVAAGLPNKCIAKQLNISPWTVATHLRRVYQKLGVNSKVEAIAKLSQANLL